ncbi:Slp1p [Lachancea thermotolerans CBS 6340]|uniref:SUN-like protein 1 n=1 Tax=Lachancea thermotolerans (strain ATCC 56472 / CBS 6340 / NRRL Y-8284) TaxID=559295 RepID=C5DK70_LACTC|nr:KLTH0F02244p [Lachancea thermotolerans CBS 6340]CAR23871.1 KLTH0F02244p [Lachancea thermotolerans CBS 6340]
MVVIGRILHLLVLFRASACFTSEPQEISTSSSAGQSELSSFLSKESRGTSTTQQSSAEVPQTQYDQHSVSTVSVTSSGNFTQTSSSLDKDTYIENSAYSPPDESGSASRSLQGTKSSLVAIAEAQESDFNETDTTFLSFDEWKKEKLGEESLQKAKPPARVNRPVDSSVYKGEAMGDDFEIDVGLFTSSKQDLNEEPEGKLYKDKFNYASLDCAATIVKTNSEASGANAVLHENKDKYLLTPCSASNKFVVIELCQDILVEEIVMANYEFFSSTFSKVRFSVSNSYPPKNGWKVLGEFDAANTRNLQKFGISNPLIWARYLRVEVLAHHGNEFYCPISVIRVHGKTMMDDFKLDESNSLYSEDAVEQASPEGQLKECRQEKLAPHNLSESMLRECQFPQFPQADNVSILSKLDFLSTQCPAVLPHLKFDQFLKDINQSVCDTKIHQPQLDISTSAPSSSTEESIFKTIMKRLTLLESNSTLSLRYIEEQSMLLSKAFASLERNQAKKFQSLVQAFNQTIVSNLGDINFFTQQLRESSIKLLEEQKLANDQFTSETFHRLESMKKDAIFQRRLSYTMLFAFVILLVYVLLTKEAYIDEYMEDDGWYLNSPPLKKFKDNFLRRAGKSTDDRRSLVFCTSRDYSENDEKSDVSASTSSASLYDEFATKVAHEMDGNVLSYRKPTTSLEEEDIDIDEALSEGSSR